MPNQYCTATNTGKGFITNEDRGQFFIAGHPGNVWIVGGNNNGTEKLAASAWINRVSATNKTKIQAQALVDAEIEAAQDAWDALPEDHEQKQDNRSSRPEKYILDENRYCTATNTGKGFITTQDRNDFYLSGYGDVWVIGPNADGTENTKASAWLSRGNAASKAKAEAQAIVDADIDDEQARWDNLADDDALKLEPRPGEITLP